MNIKVKGYFQKISGVYINLPAPVKASMWFTICSILQKGVSMITVPIFTRLLTPEQYGVYSVYQSWYSVIAIFATLNLSAGVFNNGMIKFEKDRSKYASSLQGLATLITCILFCVYIVAIDFWNNIFGLSTLFIVAMFAQLLFEPAYLFWSARQRFSYRYKKLVMVTLIIAITSPLLGVIAVLSTTFKVEARILSYVLVQVCIGMVFYIYNVRKGKTLFNKQYWKFALAFNLPLIPHYLSMSILGQADRIMISKMVGTDKAAIYSVAYNVSSLMTIVTTAINNSFIPYTYKALKEKNYKGIEKNSNSLLIFIGVAVLLVMAFGPEIIKIFAPVEYYEAIWVIPPVTVGVYFMFTYPLFGNVEFYFEENKFIMIASCVGAVANIILNYLFIPKFGYIAAGYTTLACYIMFAVAHYIFHKKVIKKYIPGTKIYNIKFIVGFSTLVLLAMCIMLFVYNYSLLRYGTIITILVVIVLKRNFIIKQMKEIRKK